MHKCQSSCSFFFSHCVNYFDVKEMNLQVYGQGRSVRVSKSNIKGGNIKLKVNIQRSSKSLWSRPSMLHLAHTGSEQKGFTYDPLLNFQSSTKTINNPSAIAPLSLFIFLILHVYTCEHISSLFFQTSHCYLINISKFPEAIERYLLLFPLSCGILNWSQAAASYYPT